jgi:hypothetical protein
MEAYMAQRQPNPFAKARQKEKPYAIFKSPSGEWEWRVLKTYKRPDTEAKDPFARWFCAVKSPHTYGSYELGDTYATRNSFDFGVIDLALLTAATQEFIEAYRDRVRAHPHGVTLIS